MPRRQAWPLVPALLRALPRVQLAAGACAAAGFVWLLCMRAGGAHAITGLRYAALALSIAIASILDDPRAATIAAVPPPLRSRRSLTIAVVAPALAAVWLVLVALSGVGAPAAAAITLQLCALAALTLALAAAFARGGALAGPLVALAYLTADGLAPAWAVVPDLGDPRWAALWTGLAAGALALLALASRDPASATPIRAAWRRGAAAVEPRA